MDVFSVSQLNFHAKNLLEDSFPSVLVEGEISNLAIPASGHLYFTLKDDQSQIKAVMFRGRRTSLRFLPRDGQKVLVKAKLSLYTPRGDCQLIVDQMQEAGIGAQQKAFEALKSKLAAEGLFANKRPLPLLPHHLCVITSTSGAALHDILSVLKRRYPALPVTLIPVLVQGNEAAAQIIHALALAANLRQFDVILLARGGGSAEDLWVFNDEALARAIAASPIPVITGIGHETDFTIADFVADLRAATPSAAAELLSQQTVTWRERLHQDHARLIRLMHSRLQQLRSRLSLYPPRLRQPGRHLPELRQRLDELEIRRRLAAQNILRHKRLLLAQTNASLHRHAPAQRLQSLKQRQQTLKTQLNGATFHLLMNKRQQFIFYATGLKRASPALRLSQHQLAMSALHSRLHAAMQAQLTLVRQRIETLAHQAHIASPLATLARGYAIVTDANGIVREAHQLTTGQTITAQVAKGKITATVNTIEDH